MAVQRAEESCRLKHHYQTEPAEWRVVVLRDPLRCKCRSTGHRNLSIQDSPPKKEHHPPIEGGGFSRPPPTIVEHMMSLFMSKGA